MPSFFVEQRDTDSILHNKYGSFSKNELETQFREGRLTIEELGCIYGLPKFRIGHILLSLGLDYRNTVQQIRMKSSEVSPSMYQAIIGTLMGDSYIREAGYYATGHSIHQMDYLYHIAEKLGDFSSAISYKDDGKYRSIYLRTFYNEAIKKLYALFYSKGSSKKYFTEETLKDLSEEGLAYWYMDDGKYCEYGAYLCVGNVTDEEGSLIVKFLKDRFSINSTFQVHDEKKGYHNIYIKADSRELFFNLINPYIIPSIQYKITGAPYPKVDSPNVIIDRHIACCNKLGRMLKFSGDENILAMIIKGVNIPDKKSAYIENIKNMIKEGKLISHTSFRKIPPDEEMIKMFNIGMTDQQIASKFGFGRNTIAQVRVRLGIERKKRRKSNVSFPCLKTKLVPTDKVKSNEYNPNKMASPENALLAQSIELDGVTQPIVTYYDSEKDDYVIIDGFHRYVVLRDYFKCLKIPIVVLDKPIKERMASTIRHNRARGKHTVELMGSLVSELSSKGWSDVEIAKHLGMEDEELLRLRQQVGCASLLSTSQYGRAWEIK